MLQTEHFFSSAAILQHRPNGKLQKSTDSTVNKHPSAFYTRGLFRLFSIQEVRREIFGMTVLLLGLPETSLLQEKNTKFFPTSRRKCMHLNGTLKSLATLE